MLNYETFAILSALQETGNTVFDNADVVSLAEFLQGYHEEDSPDYHPVLVHINLENVEWYLLAEELLVAA